MTASPPPPLQLSCNDCAAELSVPTYTHGDILEGPCPFCAEEQKFVVPGSPSLSLDFHSFDSESITKPVDEEAAAAPKKKHTIIDVVALSTILGLLIALAGTAWTKL